MSEYISNCPKCGQQILCDTEHVGMRVACPLCMQGIILPPPPSGHGAGSAPANPAKTGGKSMIPMVAAIGGAVVLVLAIGIGIWMAKSKPATVTAPVAPVAASTPTAPPPAPVPPPETPVPTPDGPMICRAQWNFENASSKTVMDVAENGFNLTLVGGLATCSKSPTLGKSILSLASSSYAEAPGAAINTAKSFTVAAWVNLAAIDTRTGYTFVSIDGTSVSGFFLQLNHRLGDCFAFSILESDNENAPLIVAQANTRAESRVWYHLAGVYDANNRTISLYVNGRLQESTTFTRPWRAMGKTAVGRSLWGHNNRDFMNGSVADVRLYPAALSAAQIASLAVN